MESKPRVRIIKKGTEEVRPSSKRINMEYHTDRGEGKAVKFEVIRNVFRIVQGLPDIQRNRCLVCSGRMDVIKKAQEYWNRLTDRERSLCSIEAIAYKGGCGQKMDSVTLWNSLIGYNEKELSKDEMAYLRG